MKECERSSAKRNYQKPSKNLFMQKGSCGISKNFTTRPTADEEIGNRKPYYRRPKYSLRFEKAHFANSKPEYLLSKHTRERTRRSSVLVSLRALLKKLQTPTVCKTAAHSCSVGHSHRRPYTSRWERTSVSEWDLVLEICRRLISVKTLSSSFVPLP